ncbi:MAG TPA: BREX protein BrxB domain-containing protein [Chloroflexota bacterium]|nr:BREX protein BrxB domain-containing protein [Chloroflexota bacterium]
MPSLDDDFQQLASRLVEPASLSASRSDPFYYFVYAPEQAFEVKRSLPVWTAKLRDLGLTVERVSFSDLLWELVDASGRWDAWLDAEADAEPEQVNEAIRDVLRSGNALISRIAAIVGQERPGTVVFLTETEMLHPYFRVRVLENALHDRIKIPTVVLYPGRRFGQFGLRFLGFYPEDGNYRATLIGGLA